MMANRLYSSLMHVVHFYFIEFKDDLIWFLYQSFYKNCPTSTDGWEKMMDVKPSATLLNSTIFQNLFLPEKPVYTYLTYRTNTEESLFHHIMTEHWLQSQRCLVSGVAKSDTFASSIDLSPWDYFFYLQLTDEVEAKKSHEELIYNHIASRISGGSIYTIDFIRDVLHHERCLLMFDLPINLPVSKDNHHVVKTDVLYEKYKTKIFIVCPNKLYKNNIDQWDLHWHTDILINKGMIRSI